MKQALNQNEVSTLSTVLLLSLDEGIFFSRISDFISKQFGEYKVQVFESLQNGETVLRAENGLPLENGKRYEKGMGLSGYVTRTQRAYYSNSKRDPLLATTKRDDVVENELCVPMISDGTIIGTIHVQTDNVDRKFSEDDIALINNILLEIEKPLLNMKMYLIAKNLNRELKNQIEEKERELSLRGPVLNQSKRKQRSAEIIGHSSALLRVLSIAKKVATEDFPVMIVGESGTGKKLLSHRIHELSSRRENNVVLIHCSALDQRVAEAELFGELNRPGLIEEANGGTLILDEVAHLPLELQAKLLKALITGEVYRIGSKISNPVNFRVISTSRDNLQKEVEEGRFLADLFYRLNIILINMPNLQDRAEDIKLLSEYFLNEGKNLEDNKMLTSKAIEKLARYNFPGNIRELRNIMERTYILTEEKYIDAHHLPDFAEVPESVEVVQTSYEEMTIQDLEKIHIVRTLEHLDGNKTKAAKTLGITVKTLYNKLHAYGLVDVKAE